MNLDQPAVDDEPQSPAQVVYATFGGVRATARLLGLNHSTVHRWNLPKAQRGCGGLIPQDYHLALLDHAKRLGKELTSEDIVVGREPPERARIKAMVKRSRAIRKERALARKARAR